MLTEWTKYIRQYEGMLDWMKIDADADRKTYLRTASRRSKGNSTKKPNRLHISKRTKKRRRLT